MKKTTLIILVILFLSSICLSATGDYNDPFYVVVHPDQLEQINSVNQQYYSDSLFLLQIIAIICGLCWGGLTWHLILKAKNSKRFW
jgi:hypothetical protein